MTYSVKRKIMTDKNIIKNWFKSGAKPTQEQFWNWQDSYWHKTEIIPQNQIQNLDTTLANKADSSALDTKANADGSGLSAENIISWKEALGVGELPSNIATVDEGGKQGNAYTKTEIDNQLRNKLNKPDIYDMTFTDDRAIEDGFMVIASDDLEDAFAVRTSDFLRLSGNMANSRLTTTTGGSITQGANYVWDTAGYYFSLKNLPNKSADPTFNLLLAQNGDGQTAVSNGKAVLENLMASLPSVKNQYTGNYDLGFSEYMVYNPTTGKFAKSDRPQVVNNFPSQINISYPSTIANSNYTPSPTTPQDIRDTFEMIKHLENGYNFTLVTPNMWMLRTMEDEKIAPYSSWRVPKDINQTSLNGMLLLKGFNPPKELINNPSFFNSVANNDTFWSIYLNKEFPTDRDWIIRIRNNNKNENNLFHHVKGSFFGLVDEITERNDNLFFQTDAWTDSPYTGWKGLGGGTGINRVSIYDIYIIKKGSKLSLFIFSIRDGIMSLNTIDYQDTMKYLRFGTSIRYTNGELGDAHLIDIGYWIQP